MKDFIPFGDHNDMLRQEMPAFDFKDPENDAPKLAIHLIDEMKKHNGIGLAANQIGIKTRVFCMYSDPPMVCFNPKITSYGDEEVWLDEGCLSYPGVVCKVKRPKNIRARFQDPYGNVVVKKFTGMAARVFQHELDHLDGIEYFQRANPIHKDRFKRKWKKVYRTIRNKAKQAK